MKSFLPNWKQLDHLLGLRSWGLILYGAMPACLSLLGFAEIKVEAMQGWILIPILLVSLLPLFVTFLLVRARERDWYLTNEYLNVRSAFTTFLIIAAATAISGAAGVIRHRYDFKPPFQFQGAVIVLANCFLFGVASLVVSSTLFAAILTKGADLPGLPSASFVAALAKIRQQLIALQHSSIWRDYSLETGTTVLDDVSTDGTTLLADFELALSQPGHRFAKKSLGLESLEADLTVFNQSIALIKSGEIPVTVLFYWQALFADLNKFEGDELKLLIVEREKYKTKYEVLQRIRMLRLGG